MQSHANVPKKDALLYLKCDVATEASIRIAQRVNVARLPSVVDVQRGRVQPLSWYVQQATAASAVLCHLLSTDHANWELHNSKHALVAGLAHGLGRQLLMLAHEPYTSPIDYRDLLKVHDTAAKAETFFDQWILPIEEEYEKRAIEQETYQIETRAQGELRSR